MKATMLAVILTIATIGILAIPPPAQADERVLLVSRQIDEFFNSSAVQQTAFVSGTLDGAGVFLREVYGSAFRCEASAVESYQTIIAEVTWLMLNVPRESWRTTNAAPIVFDAMFALGCTIGPMERKP